MYVDWYENHPDYGAGTSSRFVSDINKSWFKDTKNTTLHGCNAGLGDDSFAQGLADHTGKNVNAALGPTVFSGVKNGKPNQGLPKTIPAKYSGKIYLVPQYSTKGFKSFTPTP